MRNLYYYLSILLLLLCVQFCSSQTSENIKLGEIAKSFAYPISLRVKDLRGSGTGFFIELDSASYFVTAAHLFYKSDGSDLGVDFISIYTNPDNWDEFGLEFSRNELFFEQVCFGINKCTDIVLFKIDVPRNKPVNYVNLISPVDLVIDSVIISAYPKQNYKATFSRIVDFNNGKPEFYADRSNDFGGSGAPVFAFDSRDNIFICGIYSGRDIRNNRGIIQKISLLQEYLYNKRLKD